MFWIEETDNQTFVLFSHDSLKDYQDELSGIGGMYMDSINCNSTSGAREGWVFANEYRNAVDSFIQEESSETSESSNEYKLSEEDKYYIMFLP